MSSALEAAFREHERYLFGICYRMTGSAADAEDLVQNTFERALAKPPKNTDDPLRPWLVRVAVNLGRDQLRRRKRRAYVGPWLPAPIDTGAESSPPAIEAELPSGETTEGRYDLLESVSYAFLIALEALTPTQRAVLILRDVFDYSVSETRAALGISEASVKTTHHRARRAMASYDRDRAPPTAKNQERTQHALEEFLGHLVAQNVSAIEAMLAGDVRALSDGGGEFIAALKPIVGRKQVAAFYQKLTIKRGVPSGFGVRMLNGMPAVVIEYDHGRARDGNLVVVRVELDGVGKIRELHSVLASRKLAAVGCAGSAGERGRS